MIITPVDDVDNAPPMVELASLLRGGVVGNRFAFGNAAGGLPMVQRTRLLQINGEDKLACPLTVTYQADDFTMPIDAAVSTDAIYLDVAWGSGGFTCNAEVDLVRGGMFTVFASGLTVDLVCPLTFNSGTYGFSGRAYACAGVRPANFGVGPTRSIKLFNSSGSGSQFLAIGDDSFLYSIPKFANSLSVLANPTTPANVPNFRLQFCNNAGNSLGYYDYGPTMHSSQMHIGSPVIPLPLTWNGSKIKGRNNPAAAVDMDRITLIFGLCL